MRSVSARGIDRRDFLRRTSNVAFCGGALLRQAWGESEKLVIAETSFGRVRGIDHQGIKVFKGIPYGANTAGANRFMPPTDPPEWIGIRDALEYGHSAPQPDPRSSSLAAGMWGPNLPAR